jgi:hypothetical protein
MGRHQRWAVIHQSRRHMAHKFLIFIVPFMLLHTEFPAVAQTPTFEVFVDRTIIHVDETFHVTITLTGPHSGIILDLSPFTKDFDVLGTSQHTHSANIDGHTEVSMEWTITLAPKRLGELVIPSIEVGDHRSPPISVRVLSLEQAGLGEIPGSTAGTRNNLRSPIEVNKNCGQVARRKRNPSAPIRARPTSGFFTNSGDNLSFVAEPSAPPPGSGR